MLAEYVAAFHPAIRGLTGSVEQVQAVAKVYRVYYEREGPGEGDGDDYLMGHTTHTYLIGPDGGLLTVFSLGTPPEKMAETIREHLDRAS